MKKMYTAFCLMIALSICKTSVLYAQEYIRDSLALVDLYNSTDGPHWKTNTNWLSTKPIFDWFGVSADNRKVVQIILNYNNLNGSIPQSIGNLKYLAVLSLADNQLSGTIPQSIGNLINLEIIDISNNKISGSLPKSLGNLKNVSTLYLNNNNLSGSIPKILGNMEISGYLNLSYNNLSGKIPESLSNLKLYSIDLSHNLLSGKIPVLQNRFLGVLNLSYNRLRGNIPSALRKLNLFFLYLNNNKLSGNIPTSLPNTLNILDLSKNILTGPIPDTLGTFTYLRYLSLSHNQLNGKIPTTFSQLVNLQELYLRDNNLSGTVPPFLASLPVLKKLYIQFNHFIFDGIEKLAQHNFDDFRYGFEKKIPVNQTNNTLSVYAGGTLSNNTYKWFNNGSLVATINGDSTYTPQASGNYSVEVTNSIATELTLKSDTVSFSAFTAVAQNNALVNENYKSNLLVYPNPAKTNVTVSFAATGNYVLKLADANGNILQTKTGVAVNNKNTIQLNIEKYAAGIYFIAITNEKGETQTLRLNKQ